MGFKDLPLKQIVISTSVCQQLMFDLDGITHKDYSSMQKLKKLTLTKP